MTADQPHTFSKIAEELIGELRHLPPTEPKRHVRRPTLPLADLVEQLMVKYQVGRPSPEQAIREFWPRLVGPANASYSHAVAIERGRLVVVAGHAVVRNELFLHRAEILKRLQKLPGCEIVKSLNIRAG
ncbi:DUF721 domain-containing protein [Horticoccus luteus]|uniref:DUF721 domain-containing protein n=1 Tax=Horticoccus luteus TaxID=2862869 RepID=A0A8F9XIQ5_9BACT|nr:DUF721 domain-containing protein [Horticoccus luteus]QYM77843.1 DUF721 domain-containing protein [Horticoccus luteus]